MFKIKMFKKTKLPMTCAKKIVKKSVIFFIAEVVPSLLEVMGSSHASRVSHSGIPHCQKLKNNFGSNIFLGDWCHGVRRIRDLLELYPLIRSLVPRLLSN